MQDNAMELKQATLIKQAEDQLSSDQRSNKDSAAVVTAKLRSETNVNRTPPDISSEIGYSSQAANQQPMENIAFVKKPNTKFVVIVTQIIFNPIVHVTRAQDNADETAKIRQKILIFQIVSARYANVKHPTNPVTQQPLVMMEKSQGESQQSQPSKIYSKIPWYEVKGTCARMQDIRIKQNLVLVNSFFRDKESVILGELAAAEGGELGVYLQKRRVRRQTLVKRIASIVVNRNIQSWENYCFFLTIKAGRKAPNPQPKLQHMKIIVEASTLYEHQDSYRIMFEPDD